MCSSERDLFERRVAEKTVAGILELIASRPNLRDKPYPDDSRDRRYDFWFDGGACELQTGVNVYDLKDGTVVEVGACPALNVSIILRDGRRVQIQQHGFGDR
jgi:hypothetical protein